MKTKVVVSRQWDHPEITAFVSRAEVGASMDLTAFLDSVLEQVGNPTTLLTKAQLRSRVMAAADNVVVEMKRSTREVV